MYEAPKYIVTSHRNALALERLMVPPTVAVLSDRLVELYCERRRANA